MMDKMEYSGIITKLIETIAFQQDTIDKPGRRNYISLKEQPRHQLMKTYSDNKLNYIWNSM